MTADEIIDGLIDREGGFSDHPDDHGGPTKYGITAATLGNWRGLSDAASRDEVRNLTVEEAFEIYRARYIEQPGFTPEAVPYEPLRVQLIDFGVNSGPERAIRWLQRVLRIAATGRLNPLTVAVLREYGATNMLDGNNESALAIVNDALVAARLYMIDSFTDADPTQRKFEEGLESRALTFFLAKP